VLRKERGRGRERRREREREREGGGSSSALLRSSAPVHACPRVSIRQSRRGVHIRQSRRAVHIRQSRRAVHIRQSSIVHSRQSRRLVGLPALCCDLARLFMLSSEFKRVLRATSCSRVSTKLTRELSSEVFQRSAAILRACACVLESENKTVKAWCTYKTVKACCTYKTVKYCTYQTVTASYGSSSALLRSCTPVHACSRVSIVHIRQSRRATYKTVKGTGTWAELRPASSAMILPISSLMNTWCSPGDTSDIHSLSLTHTHSLSLAHTNTHTTHNTHTHTHGHDLANLFVDEHLRPSGDTFNSR